MRRTNSDRAAWRVHLTAGALAGGAIAVQLATAPEVAAGGLYALAVLSTWRAPRRWISWAWAGLCAALLVVGVGLEIVSGGRAVTFANGAIGAIVLGAAIVAVETHHRALLRLCAIATRDPLTGAVNRRSLAARLGAAVARAEQAGHQLALCFFDLDRFKLVNDRFGHDAGDAILARVARALGDAVRSSDLVARVGGDEFVVVLDEVRDGAEAERIAARLGEAIHRAARQELGGALLGVSGGVSLYPDDAADAAALMTLADAGMYREKTAHRARRRDRSFRTTEPAVVSPPGDVEVALEPTSSAL